MVTGDSVVTQNQGRDRGQAITLEAVTAAILLLAAVGFALEMTAVTPLSASTSSQHLENQLQATGEGVLAGGAESGALKDAVLYWNTTDRGYHGAGTESYYQSVNDAPNEFLESTERFLSDRNVAYNVRIHYQTEDGVGTQRMVVQGQPSDHAVSASRTVVLLEDDRLLDQNSEATGTTLKDTDAFYAPDVGIGASDSQAVYNLVRVEVIAWRI